MVITMIILVVENKELPEPTVQSHDGYWLDPPVDPAYLSIMGKN